MMVATFDDVDSCRQLVAFHDDAEFVRRAERAWAGLYEMTADITR